MTLRRIAALTLGLSLLVPGCEVYDAPPAVSLVGDSDGIRELEEGLENLESLEGL